jgi:hypothetical protein
MAQLTAAQLSDCRTGLDAVAVLQKYLAATKHYFTSHTKTVVVHMPNISQLAPTFLRSQSLDGVDYLHICFSFPKDSTNQHLSSCKSEE